MGVKNKGFSEKSKAMADYMNTHSDIFKRYASTMGAELLRLTRKNTPVDTGYLRRGWTSKTHNDFDGSATCHIYNLVEYGPSVEYGHRIIRNGKVYGYVPGQFFFTHAKSFYRPIHRQLMRDMQKELAEKLGYKG